jgi:hypothetical protein
MIDIYPASIYYAEKELKNNYDLALKAVNKDGDVIEYLSENLRNNKQIKFIALKNSKIYFNLNH